MARSVCLRDECLGHRGGSSIGLSILRNLPHLGRTQGAGPGGTSVLFVFMNVGLGGTEEEPGGLLSAATERYRATAVGAETRGGLSWSSTQECPPLRQARAQRDFGRPLGDHCYMSERVSDQHANGRQSRVWITITIFQIETSFRIGSAAGPSHLSRRNIARAKRCLHGCPGP